MKVDANPNFDVTRTNLKTARESKALGTNVKTLGDRQKIKELAKDFEAIFFGIMLKSMRDTVPKDSMLSGGNAEDIYRSMLDSEYANLMAEKQATGLSEAIESYLLEASGMKPLPAKGLESQGIKAYKQSVGREFLNVAKDPEKIP